MAFFVEKIFIMTKKLTLLTLTFLLGSIAANAQFNTGRYLLGGDLNFRNEKTDKDVLKNESFNTSIKLGKVIKENTIVGISVSYGNTKYEYLTNPRQEYQQYGAGVFYRKYKPLSKSFHLFGEGSLNYSHSTSKQKDSQGNKTKSTGNGASIGLMPGLSYSLTNRIQVELIMPSLFGIGYSHEKSEYTYTNGANPQSTKRNAFSFNTNLDGNLLSNFGLGFKFVLGK